MKYSAPRSMKYLASLDVKIYAPQGNSRAQCNS